MEKLINNTIFKYYEDFWLTEVNFNETQSTVEIYKDEINEKLLIKKKNQEKFLRFDQSCFG